MHKQYLFWNLRGMELTHLMCYYHTFTTNKSMVIYYTCIIWIESCYSTREYTLVETISLWCENKIPLPKWTLASTNDEIWKEFVICCLAYTHDRSCRLQGALDGAEDTYIIGVYKTKLYLNGNLIQFFHKKLHYFFQAPTIKYKYFNIINIAF